MNYLRPKSLSRNRVRFEEFHTHTSNPETGSSGYKPVFVALFVGKAIITILTLFKVLVPTISSKCLHLFMFLVTCPPSPSPSSSPSSPSSARKVWSVQCRMLVMARALPGSLVFSLSSLSFNADDDSEEFSQLSPLVSWTAHKPVCTKFFFQNHGDYFSRNMSNILVIMM